MTDPWQVDEWTVDAGFAKIEQQWGLVSALLGTPELYGERDPAVSGWSCGEHAGHIAMVSLWIATEIGANLTQPDRDADGAWADPTAGILEAGVFPRGVAQAPERVDTKGRPRDEFLPVLPLAIEAWASLRGKAAELTACEARFPHFILGYLTSAEWVRFCAIHTAHHMRVVRDIRGGKGA